MGRRGSHGGVDDVCRVVTWAEDRSDRGPQRPGGHLVPNRHFSELWGEAGWIREGWGWRAGRPRGQWCHVDGRWRRCPWGAEVSFSLRRRESLPGTTSGQGSCCHRLTLKWPPWAAACCLPRAGGLSCALARESGDIRLCPQPYPRLSGQWTGRGSVGPLRPLCLSPRRMARIGLGLRLRRRGAFISRRLTLVVATVAPCSPRPSRAGEGASSPSLTLQGPGPGSE